MLEYDGAKIAVGTTVLKDSLTFGGDSCGIVANYNLRCDISEFICTSKDLFKMALLYKLGANILLERRITTRMNKFTMVLSEEKMMALMEEYEDKYDKLMAATMDNMNANEDAVCFSCRKRRNYKYLRP